MYSEVEEGYGIIKYQYGVEQDNYGRFYKWRGCARWVYRIFN